jgi:peptidoglycan/LPS O-acetylase OafA/YrhL
LLSLFNRPALTNLPVACYRLPKKLLTRLRRMTTAQKNRPEKIHALTSLRFFAAFYVVLYHTLQMGFKDLAAGSPVQKAVSLGYISVSFFFLLSGYILAVVYLRDGRAVRKSSFYVARFARVYPLFFITLLADTPYVLSENASRFTLGKAVMKTIATFSAHVLMLQAWLPGIHGIDQPNWSLSVETVFYLIFPFVGVALWKLKGLRLWAAAITIWVLSQIAVTLVAPHVAISTAKFHPLLHIGTFSLGILLARWQSVRRQRDGSSPLHARSIAIVLLVAIGVLALVINRLDLLPVPNLNAGLLSPIFAMVIWACSGSTSLPARLLSVRWLVVLGEASFGLYLIHIPVLHLFEALHWDNVRALYPVYLATCIGLSVVSFYWLETPTRKWILKTLQTRPKETMEAASDAQ